MSGSGELIFQDPETGAPLSILVEEDTIWMTQKQISRVFEVTESTVSGHLANAYAIGEIDVAETRRGVRIANDEGGRTVNREIRHYNLDAVLSIGYRVSSKRGTRFRRWATQALRERLMADLDAKRRADSAALKEMVNAFNLARMAIEASTEEDGPPPMSEEARAILDVVDRYARSFTMLLQYDEDRLPEPSGEGESLVELTIEDARFAITQLKSRLAEKGEDTDLLGQERGGALEGILGAIEQTFGGEPLYPGWRSKAAHLLYFIIKDHPFADGNKRIGSFLFLHYVDRQGRLKLPDGRPRIEDNALVAMALLIAQSEPAHRELVLRLIDGLIGPADDDADAAPTAGPVIDATAPETDARETEEPTADAPGAAAAKTPDAERAPASPKESSAA